MPPLLGPSQRHGRKSLVAPVLIRAVGNNSYAIGAFGEDHQGSLVYRVILGTPGTEFYDVTVDSESGNVLTDFHG